MAPGRPSDRHAVKVRLRRAGLHTVCEEAKCPNIAECFGADTATFLILGNVCTRRCRFCAVRKNDKPLTVDSGEPLRVAETIRELGISHSVITSVTRDDLPDGGAGHFKACIEAIRKKCPSTTVEVLVPDFQGSPEAVGKVLEAQPEVWNHNMETVPRLYPLVRPGAEFSRSLELLSVAAKQTGLVVKSGLMVGMGEKDEEVMEVLGTLAQAGCQVVTIGQYLQPCRESLEVVRRVSDEQYTRFTDHGRTLGLLVLAGPLVRSSYRAREVMQGLGGGAS